MKPNLYRDKAIETIIKPVNISGVRGVMALVSAVKADIGQRYQDDHAVLYKFMISDPNYKRIKLEWLHQLFDLPVMCYLSYILVCFMSLLFVII